MDKLKDKELLNTPEESSPGGFGWSYAMIKVAEEGEDEIGQIVEIVWGKDGTPDGFAKANLITIQEVEMAAKDIASQEGKLNTYFWDNGAFEHKTTWTGEYYVHDYSWTPHKSEEDEDDEEDEDEEDDDSWKLEQATQAGMMGGTQAFLESSGNYVVNSYDRDDIWDEDDY